MNSISSSPSLSNMPNDVKNYISSFLTKTCRLKLHSINNAFRKAYMDQLQEDKGLYGKNLVYEGIPYYVKACEWLDNPRNKNEIIEKKLEKFLFSRSIEKTNYIETKKKIEKILSSINIEKTIYNVCGGKEKFKALKILRFDDSIDHSLYINNGLIKINKLEIGESIMRGIAPNQHPFLALSVKWITPSFEENRILVLHQKINSSLCQWKLLEVSRDTSTFDVYISTDDDNYMRLNHKNSFSFFQNLLSGNRVSFLNGTYQLAKRG